MIKTLKQLLRRSPSIAEQTTAQVFHPHRMRIGEDTLHFNIPHNFSHDVPMSPLPESIDLNTLSFDGEDLSFKNLWRAWWSFYTPGLFSREIGTLMMSIDVFKVHPAFKQNIYERENFIEAMQINLVNTYAAFNRKVLDNGNRDQEIHLPHRPTEYKLSRAKNDQTWMLHAIFCDTGPDCYIRFNIPLSEAIYLGVSFHEPTHGSGQGHLYTLTVRQYIELISQTIYLESKTGIDLGESTNDSPNTHDIDLWPGLWIDQHAEELNTQLAQGQPINAAQTLHSKPVKITSRSQ